MAASPAGARRPSAVGTLSIRMMSHEVRSRSLMWAAMIVPFGSVHSPPHPAGYRAFSAAAVAGLNTFTNSAL